MPVMEKTALQEVNFQHPELTASTKIGLVETGGNKKCGNGDAYARHLVLLSNRLGH